MSIIVPHLPASFSNSSSLLLYSSGSEGAAKAVVLSHRALLASAKATNAAIPWAAQSTWLACMPLHHIAGISIIVRCLVGGHSCRLTKGFSAEQVIGLANDRVFTHISLVPTMLRRLLQQGFESWPELQLVLVGGAPMSSALRSAASTLPLRESYGVDRDLRAGDMRRASTR